MSKTWLLVNAVGGNELVPGEADLVWEDGRPKEIIAPAAVLDQRFRKTVMTPLGSNPFDRFWGFDVRRIVGTKSTGEETTKLIGLGLERMTAKMVASQQETETRIPLEDAEKIDGLSHISVFLQGGDVDVRVSVATEAQTVDDIIVTGVIRGLP